MKNQKWLILFVVLVLMAGTAGALIWLKGHQRLGKPGIKATPIPGSTMMKIDLPEHVPDFTSTNVPESEVNWVIFQKTPLMPGVSIRPRWLPKYAEIRRRRDSSR